MCNYLTSEIIKQQRENFIMESSNFYEMDLDHISMIISIEK